MTGDADLKKRFENCNAFPIHLYSDKFFHGSASNNNRTLLMMPEQQERL